jgi:hypothetical protein
MPWAERPNSSSAASGCRSLPDAGSISATASGVGAVAPRLPQAYQWRKAGLRYAPTVEDYTSKYKGEQVEVAMFGGDYHEGVLTAYCAVDEVPHIELNGHILIPLQNIASLHCTSRCDAPEPDWPPRGFAEDER